MVEWNFEKQASRLAKTPLSKRKRVARFAALFGEQAKAKPGDLTYALAPLLRQAIDKPDPTDFETNVAINVVPGGKEEEEDRRLLDLFPEELSLEDLESLRKFEPKLLGWLAAEEKHVVSFVADPITALSESELEIDPELLQRLKGIRARFLQETPPPSIPIQSLKVKAVP